MMVALALLGATVLGCALSHQPPVPPASVAQGEAQPVTAPLPLEAAPQPPAAPPPAEPQPSRTSNGLAAAPPISIRIPAIDVSSPVNTVGLNPDGTMQVPQPGPLYDQAAWYQHSPTPGEIGPSVIIGHIDSKADGPSVFYRLARLTPGQRIEVTRADRTSVTFEVDSVASYPKDAFPIRTVYGDTTEPALRLITCGGSFDNATREYRDNTVVFAHLVATTSRAG